MHSVNEMDLWGDCHGSSESSRSVVLFLVVYCSLEECCTVTSSESWKRYNHT